MHASLPIRLPSIFAALAVLALAGCGGDPSPLQAGGPHQGVMIKLPASRGYAELVLEPLVKPSPRMASTEVALYFLGGDMATPLAALPADVEINMLDPETRQKAVRKFAPSPRTGDPVGAARFATGPIDHDYSGVALGGTLTARMDGPIAVDF